MFWKKLCLINLTILYISLKLYLLIASSLSDKEETNIKIITDSFKDLRKKLNCNLTEIFSINEKLVEKFDNIRVRKF